MDGKIFVIDSYEEMEQRGKIFFSPWWPSELKDLLAGAYYVVHRKDSFHHDCWSLVEHYGLNDHARFVSLDDADVKNWTALEVDISPFIRELRKSKRERLAKIKQELGKEDPDCWAIKQIAWDSRFWFVWEVSFEPEVGLLDHLIELQSEKGAKKILITETFQCIT